MFMMVMAFSMIFYLQISLFNWFYVILYSTGGRNLKGKNRGGNMKLKFGGKRKAREDGQLEGVIDDLGEEEDEEVADGQPMKID